MSNAYLSPILQDPQFNDDGTFLAGGLIWFYQAGTSTPILAYTTPVADTPWSNPIQLNARGETGGEIWLLSGSAYKMVVEEPPQYGQAHGVVISTFDNITGVNDPGTISIQNWVSYTGTPTYVSSTSFSVTGDARLTFLTDRRVKMLNSDSTTFYATVVSTSYATGVTTVVVSPDYGDSVSSLIEAVSYGFIETGNVSSIPVPINAGSAAGGSQYQMWMNYNGTNLVWSKNADVASSIWPISIQDLVFPAPSGSSGQIDFPNGYKLCFGNASASVGGTATTLPVIYTSASTYVVMATTAAATAGSGPIIVDRTNGTTFNAYNSSGASFMFLAFGY